MNTDQIINNESNQDVLIEFFTGIASGDYYDGTSYQLYLDLDDGSLSIHREASSNSWLQRDDGSLVRIIDISGYCDTPADELLADGDDLNDFGYADWLDEIERRIEQAA